MTTTNEMLARELKPDLFAPLRGDVVRSGPQPVSAGIFWPDRHTLAEVISAARAIERLGYEPQLKFTATGEDPEAIEIIVHDVPTLLTKLRASLSATNHKEGCDS